MSGQSDRKGIVMMMTRTTAAALALISTVYPLAANAEQFRHQGEYSVDCRKAGLQCWWEITGTGRQQDGTPGFSFRFVAADRLDASKVHCSMDGEGFADVLAIGEGLVAYMGTERTSLHMRESRDGVLFAFANATDGMPLCGGANMEGNLTPIGY